LKAIARGAALLVLTLMALDLADSPCDPAAAPGLGPTVGTAGAERTDACGSICVSDCFCCSTSLPVTQVILVERPAPVTDRPLLLVDEISSGFSTLPDHVPLTTL